MHHNFYLETELAMCSLILLHYPFYPVFFIINMLCTYMNNYEG